MLATVPPVAFQRTVFRTPGPVCGFSELDRDEALAEAMLVIRRLLEGLRVEPAGSGD